MLKIKIIWIVWYRAINVSHVLSRAPYGFWRFENYAKYFIDDEWRLDLEPSSRTGFSIVYITIGAAQCRCNDIVAETDLSLGRERPTDDSDDDNGVNMHYVYDLRPCAPEFIAPGKTSLLWPFYSAEETLGDYQGFLLPIESFSSLSIILLRPSDDVGL